MSKKLYEKMTAGTMADSSTQPKLNSSAKLLPNPLLCAGLCRYCEHLANEYDDEFQATAICLKKFWLDRKYKIKKPIMQCELYLPCT